MEETGNKQLFDISVIQEAKTHLHETAKWARFLAICGIIFIVLMIIGGSYIALTVTKTDAELRRLTREQGVSAESLGAMMIFVYVAIGLLYFFPCLFTLQFAKKMKLALASNDDLLLSESFRSLKKTFRYMGILTIIFLALFFLGLISGGLTPSEG